MTLIYRFGRFELRPAARLLLVDSRPAALGARAFDLLLALLERRDRLVTKNELLELVWPGLVVEENNLQVQVSALRKLLGQDAIATVAGRGYRCTLEPTQTTSAPHVSSFVAKHNLPAPVSSFIGRERELSNLRAMLASHRLVTLVGIGGIGKTRLTLQVATTLADAYADGVWFVDLAPVSDPRLVANAVATAVGVREEPGQPIIGALQRFVADRALLLVLDNCEHLLVACAQLARDLLQAGRKLTIVATSREPLHVPGEATFPVAPLPVPEPAGDLAPDTLGGYAAAQLFLDRAIDARPDFALTRESAAAVARICRDLDGIPLALELAAARARSMSVDAIADHLTDRFALLKGRDRTALPRQQTLRAAIDWSYDLLAPPERALLQRLSVFAGGFALDGAEAVGAADGVAPNDVLDLLDHLVDKSLVAFDAPTERYRLLETVRQYALEHLAESGDEAASRDRHLAFYVTLSQRAGSEILGPAQDTWHKRLDAERENILLAFSHARRAPGGGAAGLALLHGLNLWITLGHFEFWRGVVLEALAHPDAQQEDVARSRALSPAVMIEYATGRHEEAFALAQSSVRIARMCDDLLALGDALHSLGTAAIAVGREADAHEHFGEGLAVARQAGAAWLVAGLSNAMGELYSQQDQLALAERHYLEALPLYGADHVNAGIAWCNLARNAIALRTEVKAVHYLRGLTAMAGRTYAVPVAVSLLSNCAGLAALRNEWALALRWSGAADSTRERHGLADFHVDVRFHAASMAPVREALGAIDAAATLEAGRALDVDTALHEAEAWLDALPPDERTP
ncbi:MAG: winged helix-turn-helix domain-containing protein [Betaproteobacteria bacterium]|nr:winged helix-turn-helix domain-containing protein [Betaproteobacteria bacterium]